MENFCNDAADESSAAYRQLVETIVALEAARNAAVLKCGELQNLVGHLGKKLKASSVQHATESLEHMERFEATLIEANHSHADERRRLEHELAVAHSAVLEGIRAGSVPHLEAHGDDAHRDAHSDIQFTHLAMEKVDRSTSPNMLPNGFSFLGRPSRATMDEETQTAMAPPPHFEGAPTAPLPSDTASVAAAWATNPWLRPATIFSPHFLPPSAATASPERADHDSPSLSAARRRSSAQLMGRRSSTALLDDKHHLEHPPVVNDTPIAVKIAQLVEDAKQKAATSKQRLSAPPEINEERLCEARRCVAISQEALLAQRDATIHSLLQQLTSIRMELKQEKEQNTSEKALQLKIKLRRTVSTMTSKPSVIETATQVNQLTPTIEVLEDHRDFAPGADPAGHRSPQRHTAMDDELIRVQEENVVLQRERIALLASQGSLLSRVAELERQSLLVARHDQMRPSAVMDEDAEATQPKRYDSRLSSSLSPRRQSALFLHDLTDTNRKQNEELLELRATAAKQKVLLVEGNTNRTALATRVELLEQSQLVLRQRLSEHETEQQRSTQTILALQHHLREKTTELKLLRQASEAADHSLQSLRVESRSKETSLYTQVLQLSERLRLQSEETQFKEYREHRNVVSTAAFQDLQEQLEAYQSQERALFEVLSRLTVEDGQTSATSGKSATRVETPHRGGDLLGMVLEWSTRRASSAKSSSEH